MARLILKCPYIKKGVKADGYAQYIATRDRVELVPDGRPATKKQEQLITSLTKDFPDAKKLPEYGSYRDSPTKVNASVFIAQTLENNWSDVQQSGIYAEYIATRPRVEHVGSHGLFGDEDYVDLKKVTAELESCKKNVWTHIVSLKREDAAALGYDCAKAWRNLLRAHRNGIAAAMNIPPNDFRWYAAYRLGKEMLKAGNITEALSWLTASAETGTPYAEYLLGKLYWEGKIISQDMDQAIYWLAQAAEKNSAKANCHGP